MWRSHILSVSFVQSVPQVRVRSRPGAGVPVTGTVNAVIKDTLCRYIPTTKSLQDPTIKTNRPRVLFPQQLRHVSPPPSPQVNRKHGGKRP